MARFESGMENRFRMHGDSYDREWQGQESARFTAVYGPSRYGLGPYHERLRRRRRDDDELRQEIEDALFYDTWVDADAITVEVRDGIVTLRGELPDYDEIRYATDDAWDVDGVQGIRSELTVRAR
jgi:osmotically-inducible protein OsmY